MKFIFIFFFLFVGCTQKYQTYYVIQKRTFEYNKPHNPITPKMRRGMKEHQESCEGQIFFNRNADIIAQNNLPAMIRYTCPGQEYLLDAKITQTWWTTIVYTRSCIKLEGHCPLIQKKE